MKKAFSISILLGIVFILVDIVFAVDPVPDIRANGSDGPITITPHDNLIVTVELNPGSHSAEDADSWVVANTPFGWYYYDINCSCWIPNPGPYPPVTYQGPLFGLPSYEVLNMSGLRTGTYTFYFWIDMIMNGSVDEPFYDDSVVVNTERQIEFSGYSWKVKSSEYPVGPGPNLFSDSKENVWVDKDGWLHLKITESDGKWCCAEVITEASFGYGKYIFYAASRVDQLDKNVVAGLFTWDDTAPQYNYREIDIEFSRWAEEINDNSQYVVQPWCNPGNMHRFNIELNGHYTTHCFDWGSDSIFFQSIYDHHPCPLPPDDPSVIESWLYTGNDIPPCGKENVRINLWLYNGIPPSDGKEAEIVIKKFEFLK